MDTNKIIDLNGKTMSKMNLKDVYFKINKLTSDFIGKTIFTSILLFIAYLFYQLGYAFLYGFYFGGVDNKIGPANIMVNQIPFAIEYIAILGIFIFSVILLIIYLTYELVLTFGNLKKSVFVIFFTLFIYYLLCLFLSLSTSNIYLVGSDSEIYKSVFFLFYIIYSTLNTWRAFLNTFDNIFKGIILLFFNIIVITITTYLIINVTNFNLFIWLLIALVSYISNYFLTYIFLRMIDKFIEIKKIISTFLHQSLAKMNIWKDKKSANKKNDTLNIDNRKKINNTDKIFQNNKNEIIIVISIFTILLASGYIGLYSVFYNLGNHTGSVSNNAYKSEINVLNQNIKFLGTVVKKNDNTYYISDINRKLIIITSEEIVVTMSEYEATK